jgi:DNA-binding NarL/FixJ family response regulator
MTLSVLVADDHAILREGLRSLLTSRAAYEVVGEADNGRAAVAMSLRLRPNLVLMDVTMRGLNGVDATRRIVAELPTTRVLALSVHSDTDKVSRMVAAGASGYVLKGCTFDELETAIARVSAGHFYLSPRLAGTTTGGFVQRAMGVAVDPPPELTPREREVLQLLAEGNNTRDIAEILQLSEKTVENHRRQMRERLGLKSMADLIKYAIREGLTDLEP